MWIPGPSHGPRLAWAGHLERSPFGSGLRAVFRCLAGELAPTVRWTVGSAVKIGDCCQNIPHTDLTYYGNRALEVCVLLQAAGPCWTLPRFKKIYGLCRQTPIRHGSSQVGSVTASLAGSVVAGMAPEARATQQWDAVGLSQGTV